MLMDQLESRRLMSTVTLAAGRLRITGTGGNDDVSVARLGKAQAVVMDVGNATPIFTFNLAAVKSITFSGGTGNDRITLGHVAIKSLLVGGAGDDSLSASDGVRSDSIVGGDGNDYLYGGAGSDDLDGGNGGDLMLGGNGDDTVHVKSEVPTDDTASGGAGNDTVTLSSYAQGTTTIIGLPNPDRQIVTDTVLGDFETFIGGPANDKISNASGRPMAIFGGTGNDTLVSGRANDTLTGGAGTDVLTGDTGDSLIQ